MRLSCSMRYGNEAIVQYDVWMRLSCSMRYGNETIVQYEVWE